MVQVTLEPPRDVTQPDVARYSLFPTATTCSDYEFIPKETAEFGERGVLLTLVEEVDGYEWHLAPDATLRFAPVPNCPECKQGEISLGCDYSGHATTTPSGWKVIMDPH